MGRTEASNVKVVCRFRPINQIEEAKEGKTQRVHFPSAESIELKLQTEAKHTFTFDRVFQPTTTQAEVYEFAAKSIVEDVLRGYNGTVFAYGQTGSGKTHTMMGPSIDDENAGIIPRMVETIFEGFNAADENVEFTVKVGYVEIYLEKIRDLFDAKKSNLKIKENKVHGIYLHDLTEVYVASPEELFECMRLGTSNRAMASTNMNETSSRSHSVFMVTITQKNLQTETVVSGKLYLVDLAGSEKVGKTGAEGQRLDEAKMINKSLSALGNVINSLTDGKSTHVPYRDSKLTRLLQESLGGNARTALVINCSPSVYNEAETLSTLRFGNRAKAITNKAKINQERSVQELEKLLAEAERTIEKQKTTITLLEAELKILREDASPETLEKIKDPANLVRAAEGAAGPSGVVQHEELNFVTSQEKEDLLSVQEALLEQLEQKDDNEKRISAKLKQYKKDHKQLVAASNNLSKENELLLSKLTDATFKQEKLEYENSEKTLTVDSLKAANEELKQEVESLQSQVAKLNNQIDDDEPTPRKNDDATAMLKGGTPSAANLDAAETKLRSSLTDTADKIEQARQVLADTKTGGPDQADFASKIAELEGIINGLQSENKSLSEHVDGILSGDTAAASGEKNASTSAGSSKEAVAAQADAEKKQLKESVGGIKSSYDSEMTRLRADMEQQNAALDQLENDADAVRNNASPNERTAKLEADLKKLKEQAAFQLSQFDLLKEALLRDLQNRCEKVIDLEMSLDTAREEYNALLRQTSNKALKKKVIFLEQNLEKLTNVHLQLVNQNSAMRHENTLAEKKLAFRNERIKHLETLLQDAQERIQNLQGIHEKDLATIKEFQQQAEARGFVLNDEGNEEAGSAQVNAASAGLSTHRRVVRPIQGGAQQGLMKKIRGGLNRQNGAGTSASVHMEEGQEGFVNVTPSGSKSGRSESGSGKKSSFWDIFKFKNKNNNNASSSMASSPAMSRGGMHDQSVDSDINALPTLENSPASTSNPRDPLAATPKQQQAGTPADASSSTDEPAPENDKGKEKTEEAPKADGEEAMDE